jgi:arabinofuranosyltransferase
MWFAAYGDRYTVVGSLLVLFAAVFWTAWLCDDAFITARSVDNLVHGYGFTWNIVERVQPYTHPAWALLLVPVHAIVGEGWASLLVLSLTSTVGALLAGVWAVRHQPGPAFPFAALIGSKAFVEYSTSGLENPLVHLLLALLVGSLLRERPDLRILAAASGLLLLTRLDTVTMVAPLLVYGTWRSWRMSSLPHRLIGVVGLVAPLALWTLFSWIYYGYPLPNTAYAKLGNGVPQLALWIQGWTYLVVCFRNDPASLLVLAAGLILGVRQDPVRGCAIALAALGQVAWTVHVGGDFMTGRFLTGPVWIAALGLASLGLSRPVWWAVGAAIVGTVVTPTAPFRTGPGFGGPGGDAYLQRTTPFTAGIADERAYYFAATSLVGRPWRNRPVDHPFLDEIPHLRAEPVAKSVGNVGFTGYYGGPQVYLVDHYALTDAFLARLPRDPDVAVRPGHYQRALPPGYLLTLRTGEVHLVDPAHRALWAEIVWRTRDPVLAPDRLVRLVGRGD